MLPRCFAAACVALMLGCSAQQEPANEALKSVHQSPSEGGFAAAMLAFESGDYSASLQHLDASLGLEADSRVELVRAFMLLFSRRFAEARAALDGLEGQPRLAAGISVARGHLAINDRDYQRAQQLLDAGLDLSGIAEVSPKDSSLEILYGRFVQELACLGMGWSAANQDQHVRAISWFDRVLDVQEDDQLAMIGKANSLIGLSLLDEAEKLLTRVLAVHPRNPYALAELAMIRMGRGQDEAAEQGFREALARDDSNYTCPYEGLGLLYLRQGRTEEARQNLKRAIDINPDIEFRKYNGLARIYMEEGKLEAATRLLNKSIENFPHDDQARQMLAEIESLSGAPP